jgi:hypothetical protein
MTYPAQIHNQNLNTLLQNVINKLYSSHVLVVIRVGRTSKKCDSVRAEVDDFLKQRQIYTANIERAEGLGNNDILVHLIPITNVAHTREETKGLGYLNALRNKTRRLVGGSVVRASCRDVLAVLVSVFTKETTPTPSDEHLLTLERAEKVTRHAYARGFIPAVTSRHVFRLFARVFQTNILCGDYASTTGVFRRLTLFEGGGGAGDAQTLFVSRDVDAPPYAFRALRRRGRDTYRLDRADVETVYKNRRVTQDTRVRTVAPLEVSVGRARAFLGLRDDDAARRGSTK